MANEVAAGQIWRDKYEGHNLWQVARVRENWVECNRIAYAGEAFPILNVRLDELTSKMALDEFPALYERVK